MAEQRAVIDPEILAVLRCPRTGAPLRLSGDGKFLIADAGTWRYPIVDGVPQLLAAAAQPLEETK